MNCAEFEQQLAAMLTAPDGERRDASALGRLKEHAAGCPECARCADMLEWLELPPSERDPFDDPGPEYWNEFDQRLRRRIGRETPKTATGGRYAWLGLAASILIAVGLIVPWLMHDRNEPGGAPSGVAAGPAASDLDAILGAADPETARREIEIVVGVADVWSLPGSDVGTGAALPLIPSEGEMELQDRRRLIEWLESETERLEGGSA
jgi:hypothetical protein